MTVACVGALALGTVGVGGTAASASSTPTVSVAKVKGVGKVLVDSKGMTLYTLTDAGKAVDCTGKCATFWPPLVTSGTPKGSKGVTGLGTVLVTRQVTADGLPLYRYSGYWKKGQANGEGISSYGGVWHVVTTDAAVSTGGSNSSSSGGSGYGY
jgi:predicted lipoprotein with Yx(FWY)xxD motif